jgi:hypothetical protein
MWSEMIVGSAVCGWCERWLDVTVQDFGEATAKPLDRLSVTCKSLSGATNLTDEQARELILLCKGTDVNSSISYSNRL